MISNGIGRTFLFEILLISALSMKIKIVDEDYLNVEIGAKRNKLKLMIDPSTPYSYLIKNVNSVNASTSSGETFTFNNVFGGFEGRWKKDVFYITDDKKFGFELKYLLIEKSNSSLKADGVLGLGYTNGIDEDSNILRIFEDMKDVLGFRKVLSYDKAKQTLTIGEIPPSDNFNRVNFPVLVGKESFLLNVVNLTEIKFSTLRPVWATYIEINCPAVLGLLPVIIAPEENKTFLETNYFPKFTNSSLEVRKDPKKFFSDIYYKNSRKEVKSEMVFGNIAYKFEHTEAHGDEKRSGVKMEDINNKLHYWYMGIDLLNVHRADFNYEKKSVTLYSPTAYNIQTNKYYILLAYILFGTGLCIVLGAIGRLCFQKKKQKEIKKGEELIEL